MGSVQPGICDGRESPRRSRPGRAVLTVLAGLASAGAVWGLAGDETAFVSSCGHFVTTVRTSEPGYAPGQVVIMTVTQASDGPRMTWALGYADTQELDWGQDQCTQGTSSPLQPNPDCPGTQLPAGTYRIVGEFWWIDGRTGGHGPSSSATITISR